MKTSLKPGLAGVDQIGEGRHQRAIVAWDKFNARVAEKAKTAMSMAS